MPKKRSDLFFHLVAFLTVAIWGTTYVCTRWMTNEGGMDEVNIFVIRFIIAYLIMLALNHKYMWADNWRDELIFAGVGFMGGSAYFITENAALRLTYANDVSIIVASSPLFTIIAIALLYKTKFALREYIGSILCLIGVLIIVMKSQVGGETIDATVSPQDALLGDGLALASCLTWVVYTLLVRYVDHYPPLFVTRKMFFYGLVTALPMYFFYDLPDLHVVMNPYNLMNLLFLGCVASGFCFFSWNWCLANLGSVKTSNWNYLIPLTTVIFGWIVLDEAVTFWFAVGAAAILVGMYLASMPKKNNKEAEVEEI